MCTNSKQKNFYLAISIALLNFVIHIICKCSLQKEEYGELFYVMRISVIVLIVMTVVVGIYELIMIIRNRRLYIILSIVSIILTTVSERRLFENISGFDPALNIYLNTQIMRPGILNFLGIFVGLVYSILEIKYQKTS